MTKERKRFPQVSMQLKILGLVIALILIIVAVLTSIFIYFAYQDEIDEAEQIAAQTAKALSYMPTVQETLTTGDRREETAWIIGSIRQDIDATGIVVSGREEPVIEDGPDRVLQRLAGTAEENSALIFGNSYVSSIGDGADLLLAGVAPIYVDYGGYKKVEGFVSVVFEMRTVFSSILTGTKVILTSAAIALLFGILGSWLLAADIRRDTLGLEPREIASLYRNRTALFQSIRDGLIGVDEEERITAINKAAKKMLNIREWVKGKPLADVLPPGSVYDSFHELKEKSTTELVYSGQSLVLHSEPIIADGEKTGTLFTIRDKTDVREMAATLTEVKQYSEDLRAQTHEFKNKLYVLLGLLQLGKTEEAIGFINEESAGHQVQANVILSNIKDEKVQAILLGKAAKASEQKVKFRVSAESSLQPLPHALDLMPLLTILGNLIDNAFDAAKQQPAGEVSFFSTDIGNDIVFEVTDTGAGIAPELLPEVFSKGYSTKGTDRGYGLFNVERELQAIGGLIEVESEAGEGTTFTVYVPKKRTENGTEEGDSA
ncbi:sensor histidine kinase [Indiicoccus explosivorum]|uniref:sensor histidine kinase n=1 Tax=Indiicoccus explosivorum TaxID=1917864 RepID=UPI00138FCEF4|nr:sensor histidine kinase [Indiicoccus explosivorum]